MSPTTSVNTWPSILTIVLFFISNIGVIFPQQIIIPTVFAGAIQRILVRARIVPEQQYPSHNISPKRIHLNFITVPLASTILLLVTGVFDGQTVRDGIVGTGGVQPLNIMALFISLAYISISLDATGLFRFLAFWVASRGGSSGRKLFAYLYIFFLITGVVVGNDPVILSGTAFLAYFTRVAGITPPTAWIFSQFAAANMASAVLVSSNPTNLVLSGAFSISFLSYAAHVILPFLAAAICVFPLLLLGLFRSPTLVPRRIDIGLEPVEVRATLVDARGAIFGSILLVTTLGVLVGVSTIGVPVWMVTVPPAIVMFLRDVHHDWSGHRLNAHTTSPSPSPRADATNSDNVRPSTSPSIRLASDLELHELTSRAPSTRVPSPPPLPEATTTSKNKHTQPALLPALQSALSRLSAAFPTVTHVVARLPLALLPFAFLMFVLVQGLAAQGWVALFTRGWAAWARKTGVIGAVGGMGFLSCVLCNICGTNIGATILLARVLQLWTADPAQIDPRMRDGAIYALALGSNFGAFTLTFSASLAGLLWRQILRQKGIHVRGTQFLALNLPLSAVAMLVSCAVLVGQVYVERKGRD
ncbi:hypothetical protein C8Q78DRAFT_1176287 [Trametes maxima]|nr:hypothetical protein C8Q78DRAFT_1176287 [Trametes maxima]